MCQISNKKLFLGLLFLFFVQLNYAQLSDFTLNVTKTEETCTGNGTLTFNVLNSTAGSSFLYSIYRLPNSTVPVAITSNNSYNGLISGTYQIVATQSLGNLTGSQQQEITIENQIVALTFQLSTIESVCANDGSIIVNTLTGTANTYEIIAGPVLRPLQSSNIFSNLPEGQYTIRVFDLCGEGLVQTYTLSSKDPTLVLSAIAPSLVGCNEVSVGFTIATLSPDPIGIIKYPLQVITTIIPPSGSPIVTTDTINSGESFSAITSLFTPQPYSYTCQVTDGCGTVYNLSGTIQNVTTSVVVNQIKVTCTTKKIHFSQIQGLVMISAPAAYTGTLPLDYTSQIVDNDFTTEPLPLGEYVFNVINLCGQPQTITVILTPEPPPTPYAFPYQVTCNQGSLVVFNVTEVVLVGAPAAYTGPLPYDFTSTINAAGIAILHDVPLGVYTFAVGDACGSPITITGTLVTNSPTPSYSVKLNCAGDSSSIFVVGQLNSIVLNSAPPAYVTNLPIDLTPQVNGSNLILTNLPPGNYTFTTTNSCGTVHTTTITSPVLLETTTVNAIQNCGSFNVDLHHTSNSGTIATFWLQKYYPASNDWGHPGNGTLQGSAVPSAANGLELTNNFLNLNYVYSGLFRVVKVQIISLSDVGTTNCIKVLKEFETFGLPQIIEVRSISCNNTFQVEVTASGIAPLTYSITLKNGLPFIINNGTSNLFVDLSPGIYNFQVIDACGNIVNRSFEINLQNPLQVTPINLCLNQAASLTMPNFSFLTYQWWNDNNPSLILSNTNQLTFNNFDANLSAGTYSVKVSYTGNPNSCLNATISYTIVVDGFYPKAGNDNFLFYCNSPNGIDLFNLLLGNYDTNGTWSVEIGNAVLNASTWDSGTALPGNYVFKYRVEGNCNTFDEAYVSVGLKAIPETPEASANPIICESKEIDLFASTIPNATYQWTGPANFSSTDQNPIIFDITSINSGTYTVKVEVDGCESNPDQLEVVVNPTPVFTLESKCEDGHFLVAAIPVANSFDVNNVTYSWTGPNGYVNALNPIEITQLAFGDYQLTVTDANGCSSTKIIAVPYTLCEIPNVITPNGDALNNDFDLTGLDVIKLEIYNRWGRKVYEKNEYLDEWHGQNMDGGQLPDSTYYYYVKLRNEEARVGWVFVNGTN